MQIFLYFIQPNAKTHISVSLPMAEGQYYQGKLHPFLSELLKFGNLGSADAELVVGRTK